MRNVTELRSLGDIRTTISTHIRSTPRHKGTAYLEMLSLRMEEQRLRSELMALGRRQKRIELRLGEIRDQMGKLLGKVEEERSQMPGVPAGGAEPAFTPRVAGIPRKLRTLPVEY